MTNLYAGNIESETLQNENYRKVIFTNKLQLVLMSLLPGQEIGLEKHDNADQFFRIEQGKGLANIGKNELQLHDGVAFVVPAGTYHNVKNTDDNNSLKLYTIYSTPQHKPNKVEQFKKSDEHTIDYCVLPKDSKLHFGSGGSKTIIAITKNAAYKYFPLVTPIYVSDETIHNTLLYFKYELYIMNELTNNIVRKSLSPHVIEFLGYHNCNKNPAEIFKNCNYASNLLTKKHNDRLCKIIYEDYPQNLSKPMLVLKMEKATGDLSSELRKICKSKWSDIKLFLDKLFFQIFFTLEQIKQIYPLFSHKDLFVRNILTNNKNYEDDKYIRYRYGKHTFDVPADGLYIKINDFGDAALDKSSYEKFTSEYKFITTEYQDYFSIVYDVYNGGNLGSKSLYSSVKDKNKLKEIDKYFNRFINVKNIKQIINNEFKYHLDWDWYNLFDKKVVDMLGIRLFDDHIKYFSNIYPYNPHNNIVEEYGNIY